MALIAEIFPTCAGQRRDPSVGGKIMSTSMAAAQILRQRGTSEPIELAVVHVPVAVSYGGLPGFRKRLSQGTPDCADYFESGGASAMARALETIARLGAPALLSTSTASSVRPGLIPAKLRPSGPSFETPGGGKGSAPARRRCHWRIDRAGSHYRSHARFTRCCSRCRNPFWRWFSGGNPNLRKP